MTDQAQNEVSGPKWALMRLYEALGVSSDAQLARKLGIPASTISNWRSRGTVPHREALKIAEDEGFSLDWLLLGRGPMIAGGPNPSAANQPALPEAPISASRTPEAASEPPQVLGPPRPEVDPDLLAECMYVVDAMPGLREGSSREKARAAGLMYEFCRSLGFRPRNLFKIGDLG